MKKTLALALAAVMSLDLQRGDWDREKGQTICANDLARYGSQNGVVIPHPVPPHTPPSAAGSFTTSIRIPGGACAGAHAPFLIENVLGRR